MNAYLAIKYHEDQRNRETIERISHILEAQGVTAICFVRDVEKWGSIRFHPSDLMERTFDVIDSSDLLVIDLTEKGVGLGIEAGYAHAKGIPIVTIARIGSDISTTLRGISQRVYVYQALSELGPIFHEVAQILGSPKHSARTKR